MNSPERFRRALAGEPVDRLPVIEWATWWDQTLDAWHAAGLDPALQDLHALHDYFGLDRQHQFWIPVRDEGCPQPAGFGAPILWDEAGYERINVISAIGTRAYYQELGFSTHGLYQQKELK